VKDAYALEYRLATLAVRVARPLGLAWLGRFFVPGFGIVAARGDGAATPTAEPARHA
jgi:hypothetical protein